MPFRLVADQALAQSNAWSSVWPDADMQAWAASFNAERTALMPTVPSTAATAVSLPPHLQQMGVGTRLRLECSWHWMSRMEKARADLFVQREGRNYKHVKDVKNCIDSYRKRIGFLSLAPIVFDSMVLKVRNVFREPKVADWMMESRDKPFTYFHANAGALGGAPDHALHIEGKNGHLKKVRMSV
jgi:hypothetical protein